MKVYLYLSLSGLWCKINLVIRNLILKIFNFLYLFYLKKYVLKLFFEHFYQKEDHL